MTKTRFIRLTAALLAFTLSATACTSDDATAATDQPATTTPTGEPGTSAPAPDETITVYFGSGDGSDCSAVAGFDRIVAGDDAVQSAFAQLVAGPTDEEQAEGASSLFSSETEGTVLVAGLDDGLLIVDFTDLRPLIPNASTSCGSEALLAQLNATAFQFPEVSRVRYEIAGNCGVFAEWLQRECQEIERDR